jgi:hypothetical protein
MVATPTSPPAMTMPQLATLLTYVSYPQGDKKKTLRPSQYPHAKTTKFTTFYAKASLVIVC